MSDATKKQPSKVRLFLAALLVIAVVWVASSPILRVFGWIKVPDVRGLTYAAAIEELDQAYLTVESTRRVQSTDVAPNIVIGTVEKGYQRAGSEITLIVSSGKYGRSKE